MLLLPGSFDATLASVQAGFRRGGFLRTVNFHATPRSRADAYERQIALYARFFAPVTAADLDACFERGRWHKERPGLVPLVFEGRRENAEVLAPILERHGFTGWFFITSEFSSVPMAEQRAYADARRIGLGQPDAYPGQRVAMTWEEMRDLSRRHVFGCHTRTHNHVEGETPEPLLAEEIVTAKRELEAQLGAEVPYFCWRRGAEAGVNPRADALIRESGFRYLFSNFKIQRIG